MNAWLFAGHRRFSDRKSPPKYRSSRGSLGVRIRVDRNFHAPCRSVRNNVPGIGFKADKRPAVLQLFRAIALAHYAHRLAQGFIVDLARALRLCFLKRAPKPFEF